jgi:hypothetical protein
MAEFKFSALRDVPQNPHDDESEALALADSGVTAGAAVVAVPADIVAAEPVAEPDVPKEEAVPEVAAAVEQVIPETTAAVAVAAESSAGASPDADKEAEAAKKDEAAVEVVDAAKSDAGNELDQLLLYASGQLPKAELNLSEAQAPAATAFATVPVFKPKMLAAADDSDLNDLVAAIRLPSASNGQADDRVAGAAQDDSLSVERQRQAPPQQAPAGAAMAPMMAAAGAPGMRGQYAGGTNEVAELAGRAIANALSTPFLALSAASRHLSDRFGAKSKQSGMSPVAPKLASQSLTAMLARKPSPLIERLEEITDWKLGRIERAKQSVLTTAKGLMETDEFVVWDDAVRVKAAEFSVTPAEIVGAMGSDERLDDIKDRMNALWQAHPDKVAAYREASGDFERNIRGVVDEYGNSDPKTRERVADAMDAVVVGTGNLPGFGEREGEYLKALAERIRALVEMIQSLLHKVGLAPAPEKRQEPDHLM